MTYSRIKYLQERHYGLQKLQYFQAYLGDAADSIPNHRNEVSHANFLVS